MVSDSTLREVAALSVYDQHKVSTRPVGRRHEAVCDCGWISDDAYSDRFDAGSAGARHQEDALKREFEQLGVPYDPTDH
ncbi:MAG TPA: hypothetical protein VHX38_01965 [Pseudonocardiaceae bacterium]|nr:hypothetical protein [Pseudonocardiaceae bacterium]